MSKLITEPIRLAAGIPVSVTEGVINIVTGGNKFEKYEAPDVSVYDLAAPKLDLCVLIYWYTELRSATKKRLFKFADEKKLSHEPGAVPSDIELLYVAITEVDSCLEELNSSTETPTVAIEKYRASRQGLEDLRIRFNLSPGDIQILQQYFEIICKKPKYNTDIKKEMSLFSNYISPQFRAGFGGKEFNIGAIEDLVYMDETSYIYYIDDDFTKTSLDPKGFFNGLDSELVYAIAISDKYKTITVVFRGSVNANDWVTNSSAMPIDCKFPGFTTDRGMETIEQKSFGKVHKGFYDYLFGKTQAGMHGTTKSKGEEIMGMLTNLVKGEKEGYNILITGHSLGGALSTLMAARAAALNEFDSTIMNVSFASPFFGSQEFRDSFYEWEKANKIKHLRISNFEDIVPLIPVCTLPNKDFFPFKQTGVNVKLFDKGIVHPYHYILSYPKKDCFVNGARDAFNSNLLNGFNLNMFNHLLPEYSKRLEEAKDDLKKISLGKVYSNSDFTGWHYD